MVKEQAWEELTGRAYTQKVISQLLDLIVYTTPGGSNGLLLEVDQRFQRL
jgi:hypothetical protein